MRYTAKKCLPIFFLLNVGTIALLYLFSSFLGPSLLFAKFSTHQRTVAKDDKHILVPRNRCPEMYNTLDGEFLQFHRKVKHEPTYMFSAFHTHRYGEDKSQLVITGASHKDVKFDCCFMNNSGSVYKESLLNTMTRPPWGGGYNHFLPVQYICPYNKIEQPVLVSLAAPNMACPSCTGDFKPILTPKEEKGKFAICVPFLFGGIPVPHLLEYLEYYKLFGVHKVFMYYLHDKQNIANILASYQEDGFVEIVPAEFPGVVRGYDNREDLYIKRIWPQYDSDLQLSAIDCMERTSGYSYAALYDMDEFLVPSDGIFNITNLTQKLINKFPKAAGFSTISMMVPQQWDKTHPSSKIERMRHRKMALDKHREPKSIHIPNRIDRRNVHRIYPRTGFTVPTVPQEYATLHHYRFCDVKKSCDENGSKIDTSLDSIEEQWYNNVQAMRKKLNL